MNNIINISYFNDIVKGIKAMKADLVYVKNNILYGTDNNFTILKTYTMENSAPVFPFTIITKTLSSSFFGSIIDTSITIDSDINKIYCTSNKSAVDEYPNMIDITVNNRIETIISNLSRNINRPINIIDFGEITNDINFERFRTIKSREGADIYVPEENNVYGMYLYSGAIPMVKNDKIYLKIYDLGNTFISQFIIEKKKINPVNVYFRFVKLQNSMYRA